MKVWLEAIVISGSGCAVNKKRDCPTRHSRELTVAKEEGVRSRAYTEVSKRSGTFYSYTERGDNEIGTEGDKEKSHGG